MWIFTPIGFFSIIANQQREEELVVRGRVKSDLLLLERELLDYDERNPPSHVVTTPHADYPFRLFVNRETFAGWIAQSLLTLDYTNFKDTVAKTDPKRAHDTYLQIWGTLRADLDPRTRLNARRH